MTRCGSLASRGLPVAVREPEIVQLLLPSRAWAGNSNAMVAADEIFQ